LEIISLLLKAAGGFLLITGTAMVTFHIEDPVKLHYAGLSDTAGLILIVFSLMIEHPDLIMRLILICVFLALGGPIATMAIARGIFERNRRK